MTYPPRVPRLPSPKPYTPRRTPESLPDGLFVQPAPALPRGYQIKCSICRCSVGTDHVAGSADCMMLAQEREWKNRDD